MVMDLAALRIKLKAIREKEDIEKKARSVKIMSIQEVKTADLRQHSSLFCQATNMNGNQCKAKASCGKYCRRHKI
jgi:hypothetical protein